MKKLLSLALALMLALSAAGCGGGTTPPATTPPAAPAETEPPAPADSTPPAEAGTYDIDPGLAPITIRVATSRNEGDFVCTELQTLCNYVKENSNGTIDFEYYLGGTFCSMPEEFDYVSSGAVDMIAWFEGTSLMKMPLWQFSRTALTVEKSIEVAKLLTQENAETAGYLMAQAEANHVMPLGGFVTGNTMFVSTKEASSLSDLANGVFGTARSASYFEALGLNVISVQNSDLYESLSRGLIDSSSSAASGVVAGKYYEVAPYCLLTTSAGCSGWPTLNLDVWNRLTSEQQRLFRDAYDVAVSWALDAYQEELASYEQQITAGGGTFGVLPEEDDLLQMTVEAQDIWNNSFPAAEGQGVGDQFRTIMEVATEACGVTINME